MDKAGNEKELPKHKMFELMEYKGMYILNSAEIKDIESLQCRDDDVWVCSVPRSGTTLTQQMTYLIMTLDFEKATTVQLDDRFPMIDILEPTFPYFRGVKHIDRLPKSSPRMIKCHLPYQFLPDQLRAGKGKMIYITRNPKASIISFYKVLSYMGNPPTPTLAEFVERFIAEKEIFGAPWRKHFSSFWERRDATNVLFLQFEKLVQDRRGTILKIADFLGKDLTDEQVDKIFDCTSLESMKNNDAVNFMYFEQTFQSDKSHGGYINKGEVAGWKNELSKDQIERMDKIIQETTKDTDIVFE